MRLDGRLHRAIDMEVAKRAQFVRTAESGYFRLSIRGLRIEAHAICGTLDVVCLSVVMSERTR